jgi:hypothetical protein
MSISEKNSENESVLTSIDINLDVKSLLYLLGSEEIIKKINIQLNKNEINVLTHILKYSPNFLNEIEKVIIEIVNDNKIDTNDIPNLIILIQKLYELIYNSKQVKYDSKKIADVCGNTLKFIIYIMVEERKIKIDEDKKLEFLILTDKLIDSCISLLNLSKVLNGSSCCFPKFC